MSEDNFHGEVFEQLARVGKALSSPARLALLYHLAQGERAVDDLARATRLSVANASQHLQQLKAARLLDVRTQGQQRVYRLASGAVLTLWHALEQVGGERLAEVQELVRRYVESRDGLEPLTREALQQRLARDEVVVLDVRPEREFAAGHIPGARSVPLEQLRQRLADLPRDKAVVAYCRGPYCLFAAEAVAALRAEGFDAVRLQDGFPEWMSGGLPVSAAADNAREER